MSGESSLFDVATSATNLIQPTSSQNINFAKPVNTRALLFDSTFFLATTSQATFLLNPNQQPVPRGQTRRSSASQPQASASDLVVRPYWSSRCWSL